MDKDADRFRGKGRHSSQRAERRPGDKLPASVQPSEKIRRHRDYASRDYSNRRLSPQEEVAGPSRHRDSDSRHFPDDAARDHSSRRLSPKEEVAGPSRQRDSESRSNEPSAPYRPPPPRKGEDSVVRDQHQDMFKFNRNEIVQTRSLTGTKQGKAGKTLQLQCNYFRLSKRPNWSIFHYRVDFSPEIEMSRIRKGILSEHKNLFGGYIFDGYSLYLTKSLPEDVTILTTESRTNGSVQMTVKKVGVVSMSDTQSLQVLNLILRRSMEGLKLQLIGRNFFDAVAKIDIREHRIQIWPGYITSVRQHESELLLCAEIAHKVMRTDTVYDILQRTIKDSRGGHDYQEMFMKQVTGMTVLTDYNNKTYRITDVNFGANPKQTFEKKKEKISFIDYYYEKYHIRIRDPGQPLLISKSKDKRIRGGEDDIIVLIPELCRATGLTDEMRSNFQMTRAMSGYTRLNPDRRMEQLKSFNRRLMSSDSSIKVFKDWNLSIDDKLVELEGRIIPQQSIQFSNQKTFPVSERADWNQAFRNNSMFTAIKLTRWVIITPRRSSREARDFLRALTKAAEGMGMDICEPRFHDIDDDRNHTYVTALESVARQDPMLVMCIVPNNNVERYSSIKKKMCIDRAIPTQVMVYKTIAPRQGKGGGLMSVATKVAIQMNAKLGAAPWLVVSMPSGLMTVGFDSCRSTLNKNKSYGAFVASMDLNVRARYYSTVTEYQGPNELATKLTLNINQALIQYQNAHKKLPSRIIFYRDGCGEGQLGQVHSLELESINGALKRAYQSAGCESPKFAFIVVTKATNTRLFDRGRNPPVGTVVDDVITLPESSDFFLVSQSVNQGSVSPTRYNIIYDTSKLSADLMQLLTYKMTHLYYNWSGTTRVPAVCQYAKKLATLIATNIHAIPDKMDMQLYYL